MSHEICSHKLVIPFSCCCCCFKNIIHFIQPLCFLMPVRNRSQLCSLYAKVSHVSYCMFCITFLYAYTTVRSLLAPRFFLQVQQNADHVFYFLSNCSSIFRNWIKNTPCPWFVCEYFFSIVTNNIEK